MRADGPYGSSTGEKLRLLRTLFGVTQVELSRRTGIDQPSLAKFERGRREVTPELLRQLVAAITAEREPVT